MPIFRVKSVKIYTGQKKFTRTCLWRPWQISGMVLPCFTAKLSNFWGVNYLIFRESFFINLSKSTVFARFARGHLDVPKNDYPRGPCVLGSVKRLCVRWLLFHQAVPILSRSTCKKIIYIWIDFQRDMHCRVLTIIPSRCERRRCKPKYHQNLVIKVGENHCQLCLSLPSTHPNRPPICHQLSSIANPLFPSSSSSLPSQH